MCLKWLCFSADASFLAHLESWKFALNIPLLDILSHWIFKKCKTESTGTEISWITAQLLQFNCITYFRFEIPLSITSFIKMTFTKAGSCPTSLKVKWKDAEKNVPNHLVAFLFFFSRKSISEGTSFYVEELLNPFFSLLRSAENYLP